MRLLVATHNPGKSREYGLLLQDLPIEVQNLVDLGIDRSIEETGSTFAENALLKARPFANDLGVITLADDSGLEVDALSGDPGVRSARYAGPDATDEDRYLQLLRAMEGIPPSQRTARFRCVIALVWPNGRCALVEGVCEGRITDEPRGSHGFGYDPIFYVPEYQCTMAELPPDIKNRISHRAIAAEKAIELLEQHLVGERDTA